MSYLTKWVVHDVSDASVVGYDVSDAPEVDHDVSNHFLVIVTMWKRQTTASRQRHSRWRNFAKFLMKINPPSQEISP